MYTERIAAIMGSSGARDKNVAEAAESDRGKSKYFKVRLVASLCYVSHIYICITYVCMYVLIPLL